MATSAGYLLSAVIVVAGTLIFAFGWVFAAGFIWFFGGGKTWGQSVDLALVVAGAAFLMTVGVVSWAVIGVAQWLALRSYVESSSQWIRANATVGVTGQIIA